MMDERKIFEGKITVKKFEHMLIQIFGIENLRKEKFDEIDDDSREAIRMYLYKVDTKQKEELERYCHVATYLRDKKEGWIFSKEQIDEMSNNTIKMKMNSNTIKKCPDEKQVKCMRHMTGVCVPSTELQECKSGEEVPIQE